MRWIALVGIVLCSTLCLADAPATQPAGDEDFVVSPMRVQTLKGVTYLFASTHATIPTIRDAIMPVMTKLKAAIDAGTVKPKAGTLFLFHDMTADMNKEFTMDVGFPVADDTKAVGDFQVKKLDAFKCATVLFNGSTKNVGHAYEKLYGDLFAAGLVPTQETRESMLMWDGEESTNNVIMIQVEVK